MSPAGSSGTPRARTDNTPGPPGELPSDPPTRPIDDRVFAESVRLLYRSTPAGLLGSLVNVVVIAALLWRVATAPAVLSWLGVNLAVLAARGVVFVLYRSRDRAVDPRRWWALFLVGITASGVATGSVAVLLFPGADLVRAVMVFLLLGGLLTGAVGLYAVSGWVFLAYGLPVFVPFVVHLLLAGGTERRLMGAMGLLFLAILLSSARRVTRTTRDSLRLGLANQDLARDLGEERERIVHLNQRLRELSLRDELTGLRNRRFIQEVVDPETELYAATLSLRTSGRDRRDRLSIKYYGVYLLDVDHFKEVNDRHGHDAGDAYLKQLGALLDGLVRRDDIVARWGGEEFLVVLRETHLEFIPEIARRLLHRVGGASFTVASEVEVRRTVSVGCLAFPLSDAMAAETHLAETVTLADRALYLAKRGGRNCAVQILPAHENETTPAAEIAADLDGALTAGRVQVRTITPSPLAG